MQSQACAHSSTKSFTPVSRSKSVDGEVVVADLLATRKTILTCC